ncbi:FAD/NAD(P)-binding protein [Candidatus Saganbacteria bacterium]|uniref:FAD/NAD(P)-binding protein n=1 Tax=Candidatus Saganbacteria bacterium TaxID=2575572 RepID=A0A9D6UJC8_UNCSA|nr:FAD/NAD(P)-binding protein [Candidatus Saganbacteria bacterium]
MKTFYKPESATIKRTVPQTALETFFEVELDERKTLGHKPGQFVEVSVFGMGEAPISVSSAPAPDKSSFELCVRKVGNVTNALLNMQPGDKIGVRGPFGNGFDVENFKGKDLVFVAGGIGIVPLRSLILEVLNHRQDYGQIKILYGCKTPKDFLFKDAIKSWECQDSVECRVTVDLGDEKWNGNVGVITTLIPPLEIDPQKTAAIIVGPPVMYRFVILELKSRRIPEENIYVSLERRMKCGVGKCGHCQMNSLYVCQDGPVFNYAKIKKVPDAI